MGPARKTAPSLATLDLLGRSEYGGLVVADRGAGIMKPKCPGVTSGSGFSKSRMEPMNERKGFRVSERKDWRKGYSKSTRERLRRRKSSRFKGKYREGQEGKVFSKSRNRIVGKKEASKQNKIPQSSCGTRRAFQKP